MSEAGARASRAARPRAACWEERKSPRQASQLALLRLMGTINIDTKHIYEPRAMSTPARSSQGRRRATARYVSRQDHGSNQVNQLTKYKYESRATKSRPAVPGRYDI
jgi:hypothetical protein